MTSATQYDNAKDNRAALIDSVLHGLGPDALADPNVGDLVNRLVDQKLAGAKTAGSASPPPTDGGLADLIGLGGGASSDLGQVAISPGVQDYDDTVTSARLLATADLYYQCVHEMLGVFSVVFKLQELFRAGSLRVSNGPGALALYRFDKHSVLRYQSRERRRAYRRVLGYGRTSPGPNARPNPEFHPLMTHFIGEVAKYWRDKRIAEVMRDRAQDPTFASMAIVKRSAFDLRNNVKNSSYGYVNVLRIETSQALAEAFQILDAPDVRAQFGAETPWDTIELVMWQYYHRAVAASAMNRMAVTGREVLQWLAEPFVLSTDRHIFEAGLSSIAEPAEEWISSEEGMRLTRPTPPPRNVYVQGPPPRGSRRDPIFARSRTAMPSPGIFG
jgi:hypothetical protein